MTTIRCWVIGLAVLITACLISVAPLRAQSLPPPQELASAGALGDVFVGTQTAALLPQIKIFGHGCASPPPAACVGVLKEQITLGTTPATIRGFAFRTEGSQYNLYVATDAGKIWKVLGTPPTPGGPRPEPTSFLTVPATAAPDIRALKFDGNGILYVSFGGADPRIEVYSSGPTNLPVVHHLQCDVSPAPGLWFDLTALTLNDPPKQFAIYDCGGQQIRSVETSTADRLPDGKTPSSLFRQLPTNPGRMVQDLILLAPTGALGNASQVCSGGPPSCDVNTVYEVQGGLVAAFEDTLVWLNRFGDTVRQLDLTSGSSNGWWRVTESPTGGSVWGAQDDSSILTRFRLTSSSSVQPPEPTFDTSSASITALIVNGVPNLASAMQLVKVNGLPGTYLKTSKWEHSFQVQSLFQDGPNLGLPNPANSSIRLAVTSFEGQTARETGETYPLFKDLFLDDRFSQTLFPGAKAFKTSRGRGNYYRAVQQSSEDISNVPFRFTISYIHEPIDTSGSSLTGMYDDTNHSPRGFLTDSGAINLFDINIQDAFFKTDSTSRSGSGVKLNDYLIGMQPGSTVTFSQFKTSVSLGSSVPIRVNYSFPVTPAFCGGLVLTAARDGGPPFVTVGTSEPGSTLNHNGEGIPFFTPTGGSTPNQCKANLDATPNSSEPPIPQDGADFAGGRSYNICVVNANVETLPANTTPPATICGTFSIPAKKN